MDLKLQYQINTIYKFNKKIYINEAIILGNDCICLDDDKNIFIFNKNLRLIEKIELDLPKRGPRNMIALKNYPNLFALKVKSIYNTNQKYFFNPSYINIYKVDLKSKKVILYKQLSDILKIIKGECWNQCYSLFSLKNIDIFLHFEDHFFIYNIKNNTYNKFISRKFLYPLDEKFLYHNKYILKIIEHNENEIFILIRDIMDNNLFEFDEVYNDCLSKITVKNSIILYDIKNNVFKKKYISNEDSGRFSDYSAQYLFSHGIKFSICQNIFKIGKSIVYLKDYVKEFCSEIEYTIYIIDILNGDIKYKYDSANFPFPYGYVKFKYFCSYFNNFIYLCDNIFLFSGYELQIKKNKLEENEINIDIIYGKDYYQGITYYLNLKDNLFLIYNENEIKICYFYK